MVFTLWNFSPLFSPFSHNITLHFTALPNLRLSTHFPLQIKTFKGMHKFKNCLNEIIGAYNQIQLIC